jgi:hypothetical protein
MKNRERKISINVYLNQDEFDLMKVKVEQSNSKTMADYIRQLIINGFTYEVDYSELHRYNFLLSNLTNNMNQIAHQANASGNATNADLKEALNIMEDVWQLQRSMLSDLRYRNL